MWRRHNALPFLDLGHVGTRPYSTVMIRHVICYDNPCPKLDVSRDTETDTIVDEPDGLGFLRRFDIGVGLR